MGHRPRFGRQLSVGPASRERHIDAESCTNPRSTTTVLTLPTLGTTFAAQIEARIIEPLLRGKVSTVAASAIVCATYVAAGWLGLVLLRRILAPGLEGLAQTLGVPWLAAGIGVSGLLLFGIRAWPGVLVGSWITWGLIERDAWMPVLLGGISEAISVVLIVWLLRAWAYRPSLERYQDVLILIAAAAIGRLVTSTSDMIGLIAVAWTQVGTKSPLILDEAGISRVGDVLVMGPPLLLFALRWWANTVCGVILVVPLLAFVAPTSGRRQPGSSAELGLWAIGSVGWLAAALSLPGLGPRLTLLALAIVLVVWAATRFGVAIASVGTVLFSIGATAGFGLQLGVFAGIGSREAIEVQWGFIGVLAGVGLILTALQSSRYRVQQQLAAAVERYRRLFLASPSPMWVEDVATGRILVVNDAAVTAYGYSAEQFLQLTGRDIAVGADPFVHAPRVSRGTTAPPFGATHRTADGKELRVEVSAVRLELNGAPVRTCSIDIVDERNDLRLAVLNAADSERERLGQEVRERLVPVLARLETSVDGLMCAHRQAAPIELDRLAPLEQDASAATTICRHLTRGASPIQFAAGDLIDALRGLPQVLTTGGGPEVGVSVRSFAPVALSLERSEHVYRIAHDAVRAALLRDGVSYVRVTVDVSTESVSVSVEDDGIATSADEPGDRMNPSPIAIRAAAARARFYTEPRISGRTRVRFECAQSLDAAQPVVSGQAGTGTLEGAPVPTVTAVPAAHRFGAFTASQPWLQGLILFIAYVATAEAGLLVLQHIDASSVTWMPRLAFPWIPNGVAVVGLLLGGVRLAPAVFLGSVAVWGGIVHDEWITVLADAVGEMLCAIAVVRLLERWGFRRAFDRASDLGLVVAAAAVGRAIPLVFDLVGLHLALSLAPTTLLPASLAAIAEPHYSFLGLTEAEIDLSLRWWINGVAGIALLVPLIVSPTAGVRRGASERWPETALLLLAVVLMAVLVMTGPSSNWRLPLLALGVVVVAWPAVRFGVALASAATLVVSLAATTGYSLGIGPFARVSISEGPEVLWGFIGMLAATGLFLATVVASYDTALRELKGLQKRYEALFEAIPRPVFAYGGAGGRITAVNAEAIRKYGYTRAEFLELTPDQLDGEPNSPAPLRDWASASGRTVRPTVHRTRSGMRFDVELSVTPVDVGTTTELLCFAVDVTERNELRRRVLEASDLERRRLTHELHDGLGQILTGLALGLASIRRVIQQRGKPTEADLSFVGKTIRDARQSCDQILHGLSPLDATRGDLLEAIRNLPTQLPPGSQQQLRVEIRAGAALTLPLRSREHLYQIVREAVNNALKHASASRITVTLDVTAAAIKLVVEDNGVGFDPHAGPASGLGLGSLAVRSDALRGRLLFERPPKGGMSVSCWCPQALVG